MLFTLSDICFLASSRFSITGTSKMFIFNLINKAYFKEVFKIDLVNVKLINNIIFNFYSKILTSLN